MAEEQQEALNKFERFLQETGSKTPADLMPALTAYINKEYGTDFPPEYTPELQSRLDLLASLAKAKNALRLSKPSEEEWAKELQTAREKLPPKWAGITDETLSDFLENPGAYFDGMKAYYVQKRPVEPPKSDPVIVQTQAQHGVSAAVPDILKGVFEDVAKSPVPNVSAFGYNTGDAQKDYGQFLDDFFASLVAKNQTSIREAYSNFQQTLGGIIKSTQDNPEARIGALRRIFPKSWDGVSDENILRLAKKFASYFQGAEGFINDIEVNQAAQIVGAFYSDVYQREPENQSEINKFLTGEFAANQVAMGLDITGFRDPLLLQRQLEALRTAPNSSDAEKDAAGQSLISLNWATGILYRNGIFQVDEDIVAQVNANVQSLQQGVASNSSEAPPQNRASSSSNANSSFLEPEINKIKEKALHRFATVAREHGIGVSLPDLGQKDVFDVRSREALGTFVQFMLDPSVSDVVGLGGGRGKGYYDPSVGNEILNVYDKSNSPLLEVVKEEISREDMVSLVVGLNALHADGQIDNSKDFGVIPKFGEILEAKRKEASRFAWLPELLGKAKELTGFDIESMPGIVNVLYTFIDMFGSLMGLPQDFEIPGIARNNPKPEGKPQSNSAPEAQPTQQVARNSAPASPDHLNPTDPQASGLAATFHGSATGADAVFDPNQKPEAPSAAVVFDPLARNA